MTKAEELIEGRINEAANMRDLERLVDKIAGDDGYIDDSETPVIVSFDGTNAKKYADKIYAAKVDFRGMSKPSKNGSEWEVEVRL